MATFTWTATGAGTTAWETSAAWFDTVGGNNPSSASFKAFPGNDYVINGSNLFTVNQIGAGGTASPDIANSLTLSDVQATLLLADGGGALDVTTTLSLNSLLNLGTAVGGSVLSMGGTAGGGTISLGSSGRLEGALNDSIQDIGISPTEIIGAGTVIAEGGIFQIGTSVWVAAGATTKFQILPNATLAFADAVSGGTIVFTTASGTGVLDVASLSTFDAPIKGLFVGTGKNNATSYVDFLNVGTGATATLTNVTSSGATLNIFAGATNHSIPIIGNYVGRHVNYVSDGGTGTNVFLTDTPCYAAGTSILTPAGEVPVESIRAGDAVMTSADGKLVPQTVIWAGTRTIALTGHPDPSAVAPIRFRSGSLGPNKPAQDLLLSPDHCLFIDGALFPAKLLINEMTIVRDLSPHRGVSSCRACPARRADRRGGGGRELSRHRQPCILQQRRAGDHLAPGVRHQRTPALLGERRVRSADDPAGGGAAGVGKVRPPGGRSWLLDAAARDHDRRRYPPDRERQNRSAAGDRREFDELRPARGSGVGSAAVPLDQTWTPATLAR